MSKEMQMIDEERWDIAKIMADNFHINEKGWDESDFEWTAHCLQQEGYHKQSEGEWIEADTIDDGWTQYRCNGCGWNTGSYYKEKCDLHRYCPNCGAKMKGGAE
jgi:NADH pyrophosphatase NudC (nudix superfamily)